MPAAILSAALSSLVGIEVVVSGVSVSLIQLTLTVSSLNVTCEGVPFAQAPSVHGLFLRIFLRLLYFLLHFLSGFVRLHIGSVTATLPQGARACCKGIEISAATLAVRQVHIETDSGALIAMLALVRTAQAAQVTAARVLSTAPAMALAVGLRLSRVTVAISASDIAIAPEITLLFLGISGDSSAMRLAVERTIVFRTSVREGVAPHGERGALRAWPLAQVTGVVVSLEPLLRLSAARVSIRLPTTPDASALPSQWAFALVARLLPPTDRAIGGVRRPITFFARGLSIIRLDVAIAPAARGAPCAAIRLDHAELSTATPQLAADVYQIEFAGGVVPVISATPHLSKSTSTPATPALQVSLAAGVLDLRLGSVSIDITAASHADIFAALAAVQEACALCAAATAVSNVDTEMRYLQRSPRVQWHEISVGAKRVEVTGTSRDTRYSVIASAWSEDAEASVAARYPWNTCAAAERAGASVAATHGGVTAFVEVGKLTLLAAARSECGATWSTCLHGRGVAVIVGEARFLSVDSFTVRAARGGGTRGGRVVAHIAAHAAAAELREADVVELAEAAVAASTACSALAQALRSLPPHPRPRPRPNPPSGLFTSHLIDDWWDRRGEGGASGSQVSPAGSTGRLTDVKKGEMAARAFEAEGLIESFALSLHVDAATLRASLRAQESGSVTLATAGVRARFGSRVWAAGVSAPPSRAPNGVNSDEPPLRAEWTRVDVRAARFDLSEAIGGVVEEGGVEEGERRSGGGDGGVTAIAATRGEARWVSTAQLWRPPWRTVSEPRGAAVSSPSFASFAAFAVSSDSDNDEGIAPSLSDYSRGDEAANAFFGVRGAVCILIRGRALKWARAAAQAAQSAMCIVTSRSSVSGPGSVPANILLTRVTLGAVRTRIAIDPEGQAWSHDTATQAAPFLAAALPIDAARAVGAALRRAHITIALPRFSGRGVALVLGRSESPYPLSVAAALGDIIAAHIAAQGSIRAPEGRALAVRSGSSLMLPPRPAAASEIAGSTQLAHATAAFAGAAHHVAWAVLPAALLPIVFPPALVGVVLVGGVAWGAARAGVRAAVVAEASAREATRPTEWGGGDAPNRVDADAAGFQLL